MTDTGNDGPDLDALIVGAGFSGLYTLHRLRDGLGMRVQVIESADDVGGTWYWNRYPGARCDSESYFYSFSDRLSADLLQEWTWSERFAGQPEILSYLQHVAERFDLRRDIRFSTTVTSATWDQEANHWAVETGDGARTTARYLVTAVGCLSTTNLPDFPGRDSFRGDSYHTGRWPHEGVDLTGKRVAVIGTGATAVQVVPEIAAAAEHTYVLQRTPNYDISGGNRPMTEQDAREIKDNYADIWARTRRTGFGFPYDIADRAALSVGEQERQEIFEDAWARGGFRLGTTFNDLLLDADANHTAAEFLRGKIREKVRDPETAEKLSPRDHPFFTKRPPLENGYYDTFNRDDVTLLDVRDTPIEEITGDGVRVDGTEYPVDVIVYATGFDAMTGTLFRLNITGRDGVGLAERWSEGPRTYMGLATRGFPNLFMITGPQSPSVMSNMPVSIEQHVDWVSDCLGWMSERGRDRIEATAEAEDGWVDHHTAVGDMTLLPQTDSWWMGANVPGKLRSVYPYMGGVGVYRGLCDEVAAKGYEGFETASRASSRESATA